MRAGAGCRLQMAAARGLDLASNNWDTWRDSFKGWNKWTAHLQEILKIAQNARNIKKYIQNIESIMVSVIFGIENDFLLEFYFSNRNLKNWIKIYSQGRNRIRND